MTPASQSDGRRRSAKSDRPGWTLEERDPAFIQSLMPLWEWFYRYYFRVQTSGWENIPDGQVLCVGSHNGGMASPDMHMMMYDWFRRFGFDRPIYGLMHAELSQTFRSGTELAAKAGAIMAHPTMAHAALQAGASVLVYPGGIKDLFRPHDQRDRIYFNNNSAFIRLAIRYQVPIVPAISWGAHDTLIVLKDLYPLLEQLHQWGLPWPGGVDPFVFPLYLGLPWGIGLGPIPNIPFPVQVHTRILSPIYFPQYGREAARDRAYIQDCYQMVYQKIQSSLNQLKAEVMMF